MRKSAREKMQDAKKKKQEPLQTDMDGMMLLLLDGDRKIDERQANPTQRQFIYDADRISGYMGPAGCAKTSTLCSAGFLRALFQPGSKGLVARQDYNDLTDTTALRMTEMLNRLPKGVLLDRDKSPPMKWYIQSIPQTMPDGSVCDDVSQITYMGLKDGLGSYEFDWAIVDEVAEVEEMRVHEINTRLRNRPKSWPEGFEAYRLMSAFNPPDKKHWLYTAATGKDFQDRDIKKPWIKLYVPQPKENTRNLPAGYYERLKESLPKDMAARLVEGLWGSMFTGQPVFREFDFEQHVRDDVYSRFDPYSTLYMFWDFGYRRPACIWAQVDHEGRLLVMKEKLGENLEIGPWVRLCKQLTNQWFPGAKEIRHYGDPAAAQKKDTGSTLVELSKEGITLLYKHSTIDSGLREIRLWLERSINKQPAFQFDRQSGGVLIEGFRGGYHIDKDNKPKKDGFYDHLMDAFRYGVINIFGSGVDHRDIGSLPSSIEYDPANDGDYAGLPEGWNQPDFNPFKPY